MYWVLIHPLNLREKYTTPLKRVKTWVSFSEYPAPYSPPTAQALPLSPPSTHHLGRHCWTPALGLPFTVKLRILFILLCFCSYFLNLLLFLVYSFLFLELILQLLPKKSWMGGKCIFSTFIFYWSLASCGILGGNYFPSELLRHSSNYFLSSILLLWGPMLF